MCGEALSNLQPFNTPDIVSASPTTKLSFSSIRLSRAMLLHFPDHFKQCFEEETERRWMHHPPPGSLHPPRLHALTRRSQYPFFRAIQPLTPKARAPSSEIPTSARQAPLRLGRAELPRRSAPAPTPTKPPARNEEEKCKVVDGDAN